MIHKQVIVTGAASGLGLALCRLLAMAPRFLPKKPGIILASEDSGGIRKKESV